MPDNDNGSGRITLATLDVKVAAIDRDYQELKRAVSNLETRIETSLSSLSSKFESAINSVAGKIEQRSVTPWQTIFAGMGVMCTILIALGTAIYLPIQRDTARLDGAVAQILDRGIFQRQYDADKAINADALRNIRDFAALGIQQQRYNVDQDRLTRTIEEINKRINDADARSHRNSERLSATEESSRNAENRIDAISTRLKEFIRDAANKN